MSRSGQKKEKYVKSGEHSLDDSDQGTAARTRPLSFDEIMIRRKNKKLSDVEEGAKEVGNILGDNTIENVSDDHKSERHHGYKKGSSPAVEKKNKKLADVEEGAKEVGNILGDNTIEDVSDDRKSERHHGYKKGSSPAEKKNKKLADVEEGAKEVGNRLGDSTIENDFDDRKSKRHHGYKKDSSPAVEKNFAEEFSKVYTRRKKDSTHRKDYDSTRQKDRQSYDSEIKIKDENLAKAKHRESRDSEIRLKDGSVAKQTGRESHGSENKLKTDMKKDQFSKAKGKVEKQDPVRGKNYEQSRYDVEDQAVKKHSRDSLGKERHVERSWGKSERESKRKYRNEDGDRNRDKSDAKKHDLGKGQGLEISERKERDLLKSHYRESKLKRRRSRSREHEQRNRKSISLSPRAHKRTSHYERVHEDMSLQSFKGKSGRQHSDIDRSRVASNGSSGHYRRHGGSMSGLGGYSPRKRKTEAAVKTPPPINRSPEKKSAKWDVAPVEADSSFASSVPSNIQTSNQTALSNILEGSSTNHVISNPVKPLTGVLYNVSLTEQNVSIDSVQLTQATRPMRRLYVENIPASASEKAVMEFLNNILLSSGANYVHGSLPCISCHIQKEKGEALVEFLTPEDASAALSCDGCSFSGCILRIKRPKDFIHVASGEPKKSVAAVAAINDIVKDSPHKIFVGGIAKTFSSKMVMDIVSAFGPLKSYHFEINDRGEPCAFLEYVDQSVTFKACAGLNGMNLGGQILTVVQAVPDASIMENSGDTPFYGIPEHAIPLLKKPTQVLKVKNVFNPEGISSLSELEVEEILEDVRLECARFGTVKSINVVKYKDSHITTSEACDANDNKASAGVERNIRCDVTSEKAEALEEVINHQLRGTTGLEFLSEAKEVREVDEVKESNSIGDDKPTGDQERDESVQLGKLDGNRVEDSTREGPSETFSKEVLEQSKTLKVDSCCHDDEEVPSDIQTEDMIPENKLPAEQELNIEEVDKNMWEAVAGLDDSTGTQTVTVEKQDVNLAAIFEVGSVFVEYRRTEASCMAAHCLHGRLFDDRVVTVDYVPLDLYKAKFPK